MLAQMTQEEKLIKGQSQRFSPVYDEFSVSLKVICLCTDILENHAHLCTEEKKREYIHLIRQSAYQMNRAYHQMRQSREIN